ncbi:MAG: aminodeoxychorismate/anthranilate synthase component II [Alphaproteobacteria bacterium]
MLLLIDNYDSFTYNLLHGFSTLGVPVEVYRNDALSVAQAIALKPEAIVISPGPGTPDQAGMTLNLIEAVAGQLPVLGVCLGHQALAQVFGGRICRAPQLVHGKTSRVRHNGKALFHGIPQNFAATRYHSLIIDPHSFPNELEITADTDDGTIMGVKHRQWPLYGVQFHPESIATEHGAALFANFLSIARQENTNDL